MNVVLTTRDLKTVKKLSGIADFMPDNHYTIELDGNGGGSINVYNITPDEITELHKRGAHQLIRGVTRGTATREIFKVYGWF